MDIHVYSWRSINNHGHPELELWRSMNIDGDPHFMMEPHESIMEIHKTGLIMETILHLWISIYELCIIEITELTELWISTFELQRSITDHGHP